jgi:archaellum component FlaC
VKNLFDVIRDKENQLNELRNEIKRVEDQIEKLRAAANILSEDLDQAGAPMAIQSVPTESASMAASAGARGGKRWMP